MVLRHKYIFIDLLWEYVFAISAKTHSPCFRIPMKVENLCRSNRSGVFFVRQLRLAHFFIGYNGLSSLVQVYEAKEQQEKLDSCNIDCDRTYGRSGTDSGTSEKSIPE